MNWREFAPGLHSAGQPTAEQWRELRRMDVGTVLNLRPDYEQPGVDEAALVRAAGMHYLQLPIDSGDAIDDAVIAAFERLVGDRPPGRLLIHCGSGNRVGALVALAAHRFHGASPAQALDLGERAGLAGLAPRVRELIARTAPGPDAGRDKVE
jgi:uncharacterized protein (TIGR01244 family)